MSLSDPSATRSASTPDPSWSRKSNGAQRNLDLGPAPPLDTVERLWDDAFRVARVGPPRSIQPHFVEYTDATR